LVIENQSQPQEPQKRQPPRKSVVVRIFRALKRYENRRRSSKKSETPHQINERTMARWTRHVGVFTLALVLVGIVSALIFWRQLAVMQGQLDAMATDQRPWVQIKPTSIGPFSFAESLVNFQMTVVFVNTGKSPAINVRQWSEMLPGSKNYFNEQNDFCAIAETTQRDANNPTVFPNDSSTTQGLSFSVQGSNAGSFKILFQPSTTYVMPEIIGCVTYETTFDNKSHHTRFAFDIGKVWAPDGGFSRILPQEQTIQPVDMRLHYSPFARNTAD
jgi:hypothetical protein